LKKNKKKGNGFHNPFPIEKKNSNGFQVGEGGCCCVGEEGEGDSVWRMEALHLKKTKVKKNLGQRFQVQGVQSV